MPLNLFLTSTLSGLSPWTGTLRLESDSGNFDVSVTAGLDISTQLLQTQVLVQGEQKLPRTLTCGPSGFVKKVHYFPLGQNKGHWIDVSGATAASVWGLKYSVIGGSVGVVSLLPILPAEFWADSATNKVENASGFVPFLVLYLENNLPQGSRTWRSEGTSSDGGNPPNYISRIGRIANYNWDDEYQKTMNPLPSNQAVDWTSPSMQICAGGTGNGLYDRAYSYFEANHKIGKNGATGSWFTSFYRAAVLNDYVASYAVSHPFHYPDDAFPTVIAPITELYYNKTKTNPTIASSYYALTKEITGNTDHQHAAWIGANMQEHVVNGSYGGEMFVRNSVACLNVKQTGVNGDWTIQTFTAWQDWRTRCMYAGAGLFQDDTKCSNDIHSRCAQSYPAGGPTLGDAKHSYELGHFFTVWLPAPKQVSATRASLNKPYMAMANWLKSALPSNYYVAGMVHRDRMNTQINFTSASVGVDPEDAPNWEMYGNYMSAVQTVLLIDNGVSGSSGVFVTHFVTRDDGFVKLVKITWAGTSSDASVQKMEGFYITDKSVVVKDYNNHSWESVQSNYQVRRKK